MLLTRFKTLTTTHTKLEQIFKITKKQTLRKYRFNPIRKEERDYDDDDEEQSAEDFMEEKEKEFDSVPREEGTEIEIFERKDDMGFHSFESIAAPQRDPGSYLINGNLDFDKIFKKESLGKYFEVLPEEKDAFMKDGWAGHLQKKEFTATEKTCFMIREDTLKAVEWLEKSKETLFTEESPPPLILSGERGVGKSAVLNSIVYYARKTGWIVMYVPYAEEWVHGGVYIRPSKIYKGVWDQPRLAKEFLTNMMTVHGEQLASLPIRNSTTVIPFFEGSTLYDLVEYGVTLPEHSGTVAVLLRYELTRVYEFPVLIAVDSYNTFFNYNQEFRDPDSEKYIKSKLRNNELSLVKIFENAHLDPVLVNGTFIGSTSHLATFRHFKKAEFHEGQIMEVQPYSLEEQQSALLHYQNTGYNHTPTTTATEEIVWKLTEGRGSELFKWAATL